MTISHTLHFLPCPVRWLHKDQIHSRWNPAKWDKMWSNRSICDMKTFKKHAGAENCHDNLSPLSFVLPTPSHSISPPSPVLCWALITHRSGAGMSITGPDVRTARNAFVSQFIMSLECVFCRYGSNSITNMIMSIKQPQRWDNMVWLLCIDRVFWLT